MRKQMIISAIIKMITTLSALALVILIYLLFFRHTHSFGDWELIREPKCNAEGIEHRHCSCGSIQDRKIEKTQHTPSDWTVNELLNERIITCLSCGETLETESLADHVHSWSDWTVESELTCTTDGLETRQCECGLKEENITLSQGHKFGEWAIEKEAKCESEGTMIRVCNCGKTETTPIPALIHTEGEWTVNEARTEKYYNCIHCNTLLRTEQIYYSSGLVIENGVILGVGTCSDTEIIIPYSHNGIAVTSIGNKAFYNCESIERVVLPDTVTSIGTQAFYNCNSMKSINLENVTEISNRAFSYCQSLESVQLNKNISEIEFWTFKYCYNLASIHYNGTSEEWSKIAKGDDWCKNTNNIVVYCNNETIKIEER